MPAGARSGYLRKSNYWPNSVTPATAGGSWKFPRASVALAAGQTPFAFPFPPAGKGFREHVFGWVR